MTSLFFYVDHRQTLLAKSGYKQGDKRIYNSLLFIYLMKTQHNITKMKSVIQLLIYIWHKEQKELELSNILNQNISHKTHLLYEFTVDFANEKFR